MKKSELKEMIRMAMMEDTESTSPKLKEQEDVDVEDDVNVDVKDEENIDVDVEKDIDVDDVSKESDIEVKSELPGESSDVSAVLGLLTKAQEKAEGMGDEKLMDQIGNTITYYTRTHVVKATNEEAIDVDVENPVQGVGLGLEEMEEKEPLEESYERKKWLRIAGIK
jgi:hypothetical protein